ncbi:MAG: type II secretion system ATPase GspE [Armatimonadetes bacterium]|nr:type II secretion system ATPase GspE [Armatimonadota bacterium]
MELRGIGAIFVRSGLITEEQLADVLAKQGHINRDQSLGDMLVSMGLITERDRVRCLGDQWGVKFVDLADYPLDTDAVKSLAQSIARRYKVVPLARENGKLTLAMKNPLDIFAIDEIRLITGAEIEPVIATEEDVVQALNRAYRSETEVSAVVSDVIRDISSDLVDITEHEKEEEESIEQLRTLSEEAPIIKLANMIISRAISDGASDLHMEPQKSILKVRFRIDGIMHEALDVPKKAQGSLTSRFKIMADMDIAEKRAPQDGRISARVNERDYDFRVSTLPSVYGEKIVMRVLDKGSIHVGLNKLGILPHTLERFENLISRAYGIILVTGPTGSGKSTTLYSILAKLNSGEKNILTLEDPVEYDLEGITQTMVNPKAGLTFASGLRTMLRQDPDIIMVGEIRDQETALIAMEAALTGHLVLSTLHTNDASGAITRLVDMGIEPFLIASALIGVNAQRLLRTICPKCKESYQPPPDAIKRLGMQVDDPDKLTFFRGKGCGHCKGIGYKGRIGIYELMPITDQLRDLILARASSYAVKEAAVEQGMKTLRDDAMEKILLGMTTLEESLRVIYSG